MEHFRHHSRFYMQTRLPGLVTEDHRDAAQHTLSFLWACALRWPIYRPRSSGVFGAHSGVCRGCRDIVRVHRVFSIVGPRFTPGGRKRRAGDTYW